MEFYDYQKTAINSIFRAWKEGMGAPLVVLPTGSGKSYIIAGIIYQIKRLAKTERKILVMAHRQELLQQNSNVLSRALTAMGLPNEIGIYSSGLGAKSLKENVIFAGVQSLFREPELPDFDIAIIDEAHLIPHGGQGMYRQIISKLNEKKRVNYLGLTATPGRLEGGHLCEGDDAFFDDIVYELPIDKLIEMGKLVQPIFPFINGNSIEENYNDLLGSTLKEQERVVIDKDHVEKVINDALELGKDRESWMIFATRRNHAKLLFDKLRGKYINCEIVLGDTPKNKREQIIKGHKNGNIKAVVNCGVLTTGYDNPMLDFIVIDRIIQSASLFSQIVGRGMRTFEGKTDCLIIDYGNNALRHGPINKINNWGKPKKSSEQSGLFCPECGFLNSYSDEYCAHCGLKLKRDSKPRDSKIYNNFAQDDFIGGKVDLSLINVGIYNHITKKGESCKKIVWRFSGRTIKEYIFPNHESKWLRNKAFSKLSFFNVNKDYEGVLFLDKAIFSVNFSNPKFPEVELP